MSSVVDNKEKFKVVVATIGFIGIGAFAFHFLTRGKKNDSKQSNIHVSMRRNISASFNMLISPSFSDKESPLAKLLADSHIKDNLVADMAYGNPQRVASERLVQIFHKYSVPKHDKWFAYTTSAPEAQEAIARRLNEFAAASPKSMRIHEWTAKDVIITTGAVAGLNTAISSVIEAPGDEVMFFQPKWFMYGQMTEAAGGKAVPVDLSPPEFRLDIREVEKHITKRTVAFVLNTPHNPTGRLFDERELRELSDLLEIKSIENNRRIWLILDHPYMDLVLDKKTFVMPTNFYTYSIICYSFGKILLAPGNRIGYLAIHPNIPDKVRSEYNSVLWGIQGLTWSYANSPLQYAVPELLDMKEITTEEIEEKRDFLVKELTSIGYEVLKPEGTFYLMFKVPGKLPLSDSSEKDYSKISDWVFSNYIAEKFKVATLPASCLMLRSYVRLSLTETFERIQASMPAFRDAYEHFSKM